MSAVSRITTGYACALGLWIVFLVPVFALDLAGILAFIVDLALLRHDESKGRAIFWRSEWVGNRLIQFLLWHQRHLNEIGRDYLGKRNESLDSGGKQE